MSIKKHFWPFIFLVSIFYFFTFFYKPCITSGSGEKIKNALKNKGSKAKLCQGAIFLLDEPIIFTHHDQELFTDGLPNKSNEKALLKINSYDFSVAINAYNQDGAIIKNIKVDGNRKTFGQFTSHGLILVGGNVKYQNIDHIEAFDSRSWTTIHVNWGNFYTDQKGNKHTLCHNVRVTNNIINSSGEEKVNKWSDGISLQCENSLIANNTIVDVTDGGIVIFGAPNSKIINNNIKAVNKSLLVGIALVDYLDYQGNYDNVQVIDNKITSEGSYIKAGIAMGSRIWHCPDAKDMILNHGAVVKNNILVGNNFGYGYAVNGVKDWTVSNNQSEAVHKGILDVSCGRINALPQAFLIDSKHSSGNFQKEFREGRLERIYDIKP